METSTNTPAKVDDSIKAEAPIVDLKTLYGWYADENHKYNTLIWQFPAAIVALNILAVDKLGFGPLLLLILWALNNVLLVCVAKHVYHQYCFTSALKKINNKLINSHSGLDVVCFPKHGWFFIFIIPAGWFLVGSLVLFNQTYAVVAVWKLLH